MTPIVRNIMALAHRWALATYNKALGKPFEDFDEIQKALQAAIEQAMGPGEPVAEIYRRQLEAIAVGDSTDPVKDAGELLVETGFWHSIPDTTPQPQPKQEPVAVPEGWHIAKADNGQVMVSAPNCDPGSAWIKNQGPLPQRILYALVGAMLDAPQPMREWVGLTEHEVYQWWRSENGLEDCDMARIGDFRNIVRSVEAKLREKNGGEA
jgi:hypothetical protein